MGQDTGVAAVMASMDCEAAVWYREAMEAPSLTILLATSSQDLRCLETIVPGGEVHRFAQDGLDVGLRPSSVFVTCYPEHIL